MFDGLKSFGNSMPEEVSKRVRRWDDLAVGVFVLTESLAVGVIGSVGTTHEA